MKAEVGVIYLENLTYDGDKAVGEVKTDDPDDGHARMHFVRIDGGWLMDALEMTMPAPGSAPK